jgi:DNA-binding transcriptional ArsR family regulator
MEVDSLVFAKAIADETRQDIMKRLCCVWLSVNDLVDELGGKVKQPTVSHHLKLLEDANLVIVREDGRHRFYTLNQEQLTVCCGVLMRTFAPEVGGRLISVDSIPTE